MSHFITPHFAVSQVTFHQATIRHQKRCTPQFVTPHFAVLQVVTMSDAISPLYTVEMNRVVAHPRVLSHAAAVAPRRRRRLTSIALFLPLTRLLSANDDD